ncbi:hypothetical protein B0H16DRAFT_1448897 [Mycena metata]|uniref:Uncharacterized protein n=1 Tax=Mycena metata TaxID=1033252 RepID=A0AAD7K4K6_9AGAR|nr:hypothetical protein B0H16DRAFT_1448897 [Mycena metata]
MFGLIFGQGNWADFDGLRASKSKFCLFEPQDAANLFKKSRAPGPKRFKSAGGKWQSRRPKKANKLTKYFDSIWPLRTTTALLLLYPEKFTLEYNDKIPAYNARGVFFNFQSDLAKLSKLKEWEGEVSVGAFIVVGQGHSVSTHKVWHPGNLLWGVVCGTTGDDGSEGNSEAESVE